MPLLTFQWYLLLIVIAGFCAVSFGEVSSMFHHPGPYLLENCLHAGTGKYYLLPLLFPARVLDLQRRYLLTALTIKDTSLSSIINRVANFPSRWSLYLSLALCLDHLVDHHLSSERRVQRCTTRGAAEMGNSKFQKYFSLITSPLTSQVFPPPFNCDNNHHPMSGILSKSNHVLWTPPQLSNLLKKMLNK